MKRYKVIKEISKLKVGTILIDRHQDGYLHTINDSFLFSSIDTNYFLQCKQTVEDLVWEAIEFLAGPVNRFTTLEVKMYLREKYPNEVWDQSLVRKAVDYFVNEDVLIFESIPDFRIFSVIKSQSKKVMAQTTKTQVTVIAEAISPSALVIKIEENKGKLTTVKFIKDSDKQERVANGIFVTRTALGNVQMQEYKYLKAKKAGIINAENKDKYHEFTQILPKNILEVRVGGKCYVSNKKRAQ